MQPDLLLSHVIAAVAVIAGLCYVLGRLFRWLHQPEVLGQLLAGIVLGPSLLGRVAGSGAEAIFPPQIVPHLTVTSQVALVLFLFAVGYELDGRVLRLHRKAVPVVSISAFVVPMTLGILAALALGPLLRAVGEPRAGAGSFILFFGVALSITAVPVLASIVRERKIAATLPGVVAMTSAGLIDAVGWLALAMVLVMANASSSFQRPLAVTCLLLIGYVAVSVFVVRRALLWWMRRPNTDPAGKAVFTVAVAMGSAWATSALGLHVIFGAFLAGVLMPRRPGGLPDPDVLRPMQDGGRLLLPVFFIVSGLSVNVGALRARDLLLFAVTCTIAIIGKLGAGYLGARLSGVGRRDSAVIGVLLNTRGLTELVALNVALQAGVIHQHLYTVLVLMALVTTAATGPLLALIRPPDRDVVKAPARMVDAAVGDG